MSILNKILLFLLIITFLSIEALGQIDMKVDMFEDFYGLSKTKSFRIDSLITINSGNLVVDKIKLKPSIYSYFNRYNNIDYTIRGLSSTRNSFSLSEIQLNSPFNGTVPHEILGLASLGSIYLDYNRTNNKSFSNTGSELNFILPKSAKSFNLKSVLQGGNSNGFGLINANGFIQEFFWNVGFVFNSRPDYPISKDEERVKYTLDNSISTSTGVIFNMGFENDNSKLSLMMILYNNNRNLPYNNLIDEYAKIPRDNRLYSNLNYKTYILDNIFLSGNIYFGTEDKELNFFSDKEMQFLVPDMFGLQSVKSYSYGFDTDFIFFNDYIPPLYTDIKYRKDIIDERNQLGAEKTKNETERLQINFKQSYWIKEDVNFTYNVGFFINNPMRISTGRATEKTSNGLYDIGLTLEMAKNLDLNLSLGRSVRAPYINEYSSIFTDSIQVLIELDPEVKNYYEIGLDFNQDNLKIEANFFSNTIKNYIYPLYESIYQNIYVNNGNLSFQGGEAEIAYSHTYFDVMCSYSMLIESIVHDEDMVEIFSMHIPKDIFKGSVTVKPLSELSLNYTFSYLMTMGNQENLQIHDAYIDLQIIKNMQGKISVKNITDKQVLGIFDLPLIGREFSIGAYIYI